MARPVPPARRSATGRVDASALVDLVPDDAADDAGDAVIDLGPATELSPDGLELLVALQDAGRVDVVGARWPQVVDALLAAPLGEVGRLGALARRLISGSRRARPSSR